MARYTRRILGALAAGSVMALTLAAAPSPAGADSGGPVAVMGIDAEDGGPDGHGPIETYVTIVNNLFANVTNGSSTVLVLGGGKDPGDDVTRFYDAIFAATTPTHAVTYAHDADLATQSFSGFGLIIVPSSEEDTSSGGLTDDESEALKLRAPDIATHVNLGGGLISFSQNEQTSPYGFLGDVGSFVRVGIDGDSSNVDVTTEGTAAGLTDDLDVCCWHDQYSEFPSFLSVLATYADASTPPAVAAVGGAKVLIPTGIDLTPATQNVNAGGTCSVTATVTEDAKPVADKLVTFTVTAGPRAGTTGSSTTDSAGKVTFSFSAPTAGVDTIGAKFTDSLQRVREATPATCTASQVLGNVVTPTPAPAAPAPAPARAAPTFTG